MYTIVRSFVAGLVTVAVLTACAGRGEPTGDARPVTPSSTPSPTGPPTGCTIIDQEFVRETFKVRANAKTEPTEDILGGKDYQCEYTDGMFLLNLSLKVYPTEVSVVELAKVGRRYGPVTEVTGVGEAAHYVLIGDVGPQLVQYVAVRKDGGTAYLVLLIGSQVPDFEQAYATVAKKALEGP